jgi:tetratricopeptide (TPR) repeat protein
MARTLYTVLLLLALLNTHAQNSCRCDAGEKLKPQIYNYADNGKTDSAFFVYTKIKNYNTDACLLLYYHGTCQLHMQKANWDSAWLALKLADKLLLKAGCIPAVVAKHYSITGLFYTRMNKLDSAAWAFLKAVEAGEKSDNKYALARAYGDVAATVSKTGDVAKSIEYDKKSIAIARTITDKTGMQLLAAKLVNLASSYQTVYKNTGNTKYLDSSGLTAKEALAVAKKGEEIKSVLESYNILSRYYFTLTDYKQSNSYSDSIIAAHIPGFTNYAMYLAWFNKAEIAREQKDLLPAAAFADSSQKYAALFNPQSEINSLALVYSINKLLNKEGRSLTAFERMAMLKDSIFDLEKNKTINELEKKYTQVKNENTIKELSRQKLVYALLGLGGLFIAGFVAFYFRQQSLKHKQTVLETEQRLNRARMNPHFFFNALTAMQRFAMKENDGKALASSLSKFSHIMRETLESTYKEYVTVKQEVEFLKEYMEIQKMRFPQMFTYALMVDGEMEPADVMIPSMIIQPFIENSVEHGFAGIDYPGEIRVDFKQHNKSILIEIKDNGKGLLLPGEKNNEHISRASQIIKDRIYLLNIKLKTKADFSIDNDPLGKGVIVKINLPVIYNNENTNS